MSLPITNHSPEGILAVNTNFYEFIPEAEIDADEPRTLLCDELEVGRRYYIVLTTAGGLYRYDINDIVEVTGFHGSCPTIVFVRKGRDMTSITGEKLHVNHCLAAMRLVEERCGIAFQQFRFAADSAGTRYQVFVEPAHNDQTYCASIGTAIDDALCEQNIEYAQKRRSHRLELPTLHVMRAGWSEYEIRTAVSDGRMDTEFKWQHLLPEPRQSDEHWVTTTIRGDAPIRVSDPGLLERRQRCGWAGAEMNAGGGCRVAP